MIMGLRLLRRSPAPAGRHTRALPGPLVPGAAAALVASADHWEDGAGAPAVEPVDADRTAEIPVVGGFPVGPLLLEVPAHDPVGRPAAEPTPPDPLPEPEPAQVTLGFADGARVELHPDDPRVRTFRAAAAALVESPRS
jgi:hypothetical protein